MGRTVALGGGLRVPYPEPSSKTATRIGASNRRANTVPEVQLRSLLHRRGLRFRKDHLLRLDAIRVKPDVVFPTERVAVFVDGCFWHCCPKHGRMPRTNLSYWEPKLQRNVARDRQVNEALDAAGWLVLRIWEHVPPSEGADLIEGAIDRRRLGLDVTSPPYISCHDHPDATI